jgi:hypothetical protein
MENIIIRAIESVSEIGSSGQHEEASAEFAKLMGFLEKMYCNSLVAFASAMVKTAEDMEESDKDEVFGMIRDLLSKAPQDVFVRINKNYQQMIGEMNLPDIYSGEKSV